MATNGRISREAKGNLLEFNALGCSTLARSCQIIVVWAVPASWLQPVAPVNEEFQLMVIPCYSNMKHPEYQYRAAGQKLGILHIFKILSPWFDMTRLRVLGGINLQNGGHLEATFTWALGNSAAQYFLVLQKTKAREKGWPSWRPGRAVSHQC